MHLHCCQSWYSSHMLHEWGTDFHHVMKSKCPSSCHHSRLWGLTCPGPSPAALHAKLSLHLFPFFPCQAFSSLAPPVRYSVTRFLIDPKHTKQDHSSNGAPNNWPGKRAHTTAAEANVGSRHSTPQGDREPHETPPEVHDNGMGTSKSTEEYNSEDNTDHSVMSQPKMNWGGMQLTLIWNQPLGIVSLVQLWRKWPSELHNRGSRRGYMVPVALWVSAFGVRPK